MNASKTRSTGAASQRLSSRAIGLQHGRVGKRALEIDDQIAVELDQRQAIAAPGQPLGQGASAGSHLNHVVIGCRVDGLLDAVEHTRVDEKVLTEAFARSIQLDNSSASRMASRKLPASTPPRPARSSAVP